MSQHNPSNSNCDLVQYPGAANVVCTCDEDTPAPSVTLPAGSAPQRQFALNMSSPLDVNAYEEFREAARDLDRVRKLMQPAQERFQRAVNALAELAVTR